MISDKEVTIITDKLIEHCPNAVTVYAAVNLIKRQRIHMAAHENQIKNLQSLVRRLESRL